MKNYLSYMWIIALLLLCMATSVAFAHDHEGKKFQSLEEIQDETMLTFQEIYEIVKDNPEFSVEHVHENGELKKVIVEGIESPEDRKKVELMVFNYEENRAKMRNIPTRTGIYYSTDEGPSPNEGYDEFYRDVLGSIEYPQEAIDWQVEGTIFVELVIDENGYIVYSNVDENIETPVEFHLEHLKEIALNAIMETSGNWEPGKVNGEAVASYAIVPIVFEVEPHPTIRSVQVM